MYYITFLVHVINCHNKFNDITCITYFFVYYVDHYIIYLFIVILPENQFLHLNAFIVYAN